MALNYAQDLADYIRGYLDQDAVTIPDSAVEAFVRSVEGPINRVLREHPRMRVRRSWRLHSGDNRIPIPDDMLQLIAVKRDSVALIQYPPQLEDKASRCSASFVNFGNCLQVWPVPTEDVDYGLEMAIAIPSLLTSQSRYALNIRGEYLEPNWIKLYHNDIYQQGLLGEAAGYLRDPQNQQVWTGAFLQKLEALRMQGWNEAIAAGPRVHAA